MLQSMREMAKSWIFKSLMMLLIISFGAWGIGDMFRGNPNAREVAKVGAIEIPVQTLEQRFLLGMPEARGVFGADLTVEQARQIGVLDRTLKLMVEELSFNQEAARLGLNVSNETVMEKLRKMPQLRDKDGRFNTQMWHQILSKSGMTEQTFFDIEREEAARKIIFSTLTTGVPLPKAIIDPLYEARGAKRVFEVIRLSHDSVKGLPAPDEAALKEYHAKNENRYLVPEFRGFTVALLDAKSVEQDIAVTDEQVRAAYEQRAAELMKPETRDLVQVVLQDEEKAKAFHAAASGITSADRFTAASKAQGLTPVALEGVSEKTVLPALYASVFAAEQGQVVAPVKSELGWHVVWVKAIHAGGKPAFDAVKVELKETLRQEQAGDKLASIVNKLDDTIASGQSLEETADALKLRLQRYVALTREGRDKDGREVKDIPVKEETLRAAFELGQGETGQVIDGGQGTYLVVRNDSVDPAHTKPFEDAKTLLIKDWTKERQAERAAEMAEEIAKALREGKSVTSYASMPGVTISLSKPLSMLAAPDKSFPHEALANAFRMNKGDVSTAGAVGASLILRLADIVPVDPKKPEETRLKLVEDLGDRLPYNLVEQYILHLRKDFPVHINQNLLNDLKKRGGTAE